MKFSGPSAASFSLIVLSALLFSLLSGCDGLYGPSAFNYNTSGVITSNLFGTYRLDNTTWVLERRGYTNLSGTIVLKPDMTIQLTEVPYIPNLQPNVYSSGSGTWEVKKRNAIWVVALEANSKSFNGAAGFIGLELPILAEQPPHGLELYINSDEGFWIRYAKSDR